MPKYRVQAADFRSEGVAEVITISGARLSELSDGLPHIRVEPLVGPGLSIANVRMTVSGYANTQVSRLDLKLKGAGTQSLAVSTTINSNTATLASTTNLKVGMVLSGNPNLDPGTTITGILSSTSISLSAVARATASSVSTTFTATSALGYTATGELELKLKTSGGLEINTDGELSITAGGGGLLTFSPATTTRLAQFYLDGTTLKLTDSVVTGSATGISVGGTLGVTGATTLASVTVSGTSSLAAVTMSGLTTMGSYAGTTGGSDRLRIQGDVRVGGTIYASDFVLTGGAGSGVGILLDNLDDVVLGAVSGGQTLANGQVLTYESGIWRNRPAAGVSSIAVQKEGVAIGSRTTINFIGTGVTVADDLTNSRINVTVTGAVSSFNGRIGAIIPQENDYSLSLLGDVTITSAATGQYLRRGATEWVNAALSADDLAVGTVPSARVSGAYTGITTVGTLSSLAVSGVTTLGTYTGTTDSNDRLRIQNNVRVNGTVFANDFVLTGGSSSGIGIALDNLDDVVLGTQSGGVALASGQVLLYDNGTWRNRPLRETTAAATISSGTLTLDCASATVFTVTRNQPITAVSFTNIPSGMAVGVTLVLNNTTGGSFTVNWGSVIWANGAVPVLSTGSNTTDIVRFILVNNVVYGVSGGSPAGVTSVQLASSTGLSFTGGPITGSGTITMSGTLGVAAGGTGLGVTPSSQQVLVGQSNGAYALRTLAGSGGSWSDNGTQLTFTVTATGGVSSFNTRTGAVTLSSSDVTTALGFTPYNSTNPSNYITLSSTLTGYTAGTNTALVSTDSVLAALQKLQGQVNARLSNNQTVTLQGDVSGSGATLIQATLANSGVAAGTYTSVTVDVKGRVTGGTNPGFLTSNQTITVSGDATGSGATAIALTLASTGVGAGTYRSVTVDAKGRVTAGTNPTTLSGYGITDAATASHTHTSFGNMNFTGAVTVSSSWRVGGLQYQTSNPSTASGGAAGAPDGALIVVYA